MSEVYYYDDDLTEYDGTVRCSFRLFPSVWSVLVFSPPSLRWRALRRDLRPQRRTRKRLTSATEGGANYPKLIWTKLVQRVRSWNNSHKWFEQMFTLSFTFFALSKLGSSFSKFSICVRAHPCSWGRTGPSFRVSLLCGWWTAILDIFQYLSAKLFLYWTLTHYPFDLPYLDVWIF